MNTFGEKIASFLGIAKRNVVIVAPFMLSEALARLLNRIPSGVETLVVTRWRPTDLLAGVSDLGIYDLTESKGVPLFLRNDLHAKLFVADDLCLVGSANVTNTALGWRTPANLELLVEISRSDEYVVEFEKTLLDGAVRATAEQRDLLQDLLEMLNENPPVIPITSNELMVTGLLQSDWVPRTKNPDELYLFYSGNKDIGRTVRQIMEEELEQISPYSGMNEEEFRVWVAAIINQTPLISKVMKILDDQGEVTEAVIVDILADIGVNTSMHSPPDVLITLERWLTYFLPEHFETTPANIKLIKAKNI